MLNISVSALSMYERGERIPRDNIKIRIASYYKKPINKIFLIKKLTKRELRGGCMKENNITFVEREAYNRGFRSGEKEGLRKANEVIRLMMCSTVGEFEDSVIQNSKEMTELRRIMTGGNGERDQNF